MDFHSYVNLREDNPKSVLSPTQLKELKLAHQPQPPLGESAPSERTIFRWSFRMEKNHIIQSSKVHPICSIYGRYTYIYPKHHPVL